MNRQKVWKVVGAILLVYGLQLHGQRYFLRCTTVHHLKSLCPKNSPK
jgi:hypothetical protein